MTTPAIQCPAGVRALLQLFSAHGERAYPVGGCVRDTLMGVPPHDWDVAVTSVPERTEAICRGAGYRVIPTGLKHGTVTVLVPHNGTSAEGEGACDPVECTTCRTEGGYSDGRHPDAVAFTGRIEDDLSRRDFTVNAMAFTQEADGLAVLDLFGGREDLERGVIRCVGDPDTRFAEDALRLLRAVRFAVKLGFSIDPATAAALCRQAEGLSRISRERIRDEFEKIVCSPAPDRGVHMLIDTGLMPHVLPYGISPDGVARMTALPDDFVLRLACLLCGMDSDSIERNLDGLRLSNAVRKDILAVTRSIGFPVEPTARCARAWRHDLGSLAVPALLVCRAQADGSAADLDELIALARRSEELGEPVRIEDLAINGHDLIALGFKPGPLLQDILRALLETVWAHPEKNTREELIREALRREG